MSLLRYAGGKQKLARQIAGRLAQATSGEITECRFPFLGGASVELAVLRLGMGIRRVWLNDRDPGVASLWTAVMRCPEMLKDRIRGFIPSTDCFYQFKSTLGEVDAVPTDIEDMVEVGFEALVLNRISFSGLGVMSGGPLGGRHQNGKCKIGSRWNAKRLCHEVDEAHRLLSSVEIMGGACTCLDFAEVLRVGSETVLLYLDPPYHDKGGQLYRFPFLWGDHERLARLLRGSRHRWLLSYDNCQAIRNLYYWATVDEVRVAYSVNGCHCSTELLISPRRTARTGVAGREVAGPFGAAASTEMLVEAAPTAVLTL